MSNLTPAEQAAYIDLLTKQINSLLAENNHLSQTVTDQAAKIKELYDTIRQHENIIDDQSTDLRAMEKRLDTLEDKESNQQLKETVRKLYDTAFETMSVLHKHF